jgi:hypothetical protein
MADNGSPFALRKLGHVVLNVTDLKASVQDPEAVGAILAHLGRSVGRAPPGPSHAGPQ